MLYVKSQSSRENYQKLLDIYQRFGGESDNLDYSDESAQEMYLFETKGIGKLKFGLFNFSDDKINGFTVGKKWMNVTISMWEEDLKRGLLFLNELEEEYPEWFLKKFLNKFYE